ncbi:MAG TPA: NRDE family protein [Geminicoccaceae bacterium]|nr:NRDE family protein [Geminicoccaceae bacterium]
MCTVVILRRPGDPWPLLLAANRDELADRPWRAPGRHWPDRPEVTAGLDVLAGGSWLGVNDHGLVATVLNRVSTLGPLPGKRSRGELVLEALDHADAAAAARALADLDPRAYRPFNLVVADAHDAVWLRHAGDGVVQLRPIPDGLSMLSARELNDPASPRLRRHLPRFLEAPPPDPVGDDWGAWEALLASRDGGEAGPTAAMAIVTEDGAFGTVCSHLVALPASGRARFRFAPGRPGEAAYAPVSLA